MIRTLSSLCAQAEPVEALFWPDGNTLRQALGERGWVVAHNAPTP